jgi:general stress protein YciG
VAEQQKERRGFASMAVEKQREIARKGGRAAHEKGAPTSGRPTKPDSLVARATRSAVAVEADSSTRPRRPNRPSQNGSFSRQTSACRLLDRNREPPN